MSRDYEPIKKDGRSGASFRTVAALLLIAFIGGIILTGWIATKFELIGSNNNSAQAETAASTEQTLTGKIAQQLGAEETVAPDAVTQLATDSATNIELTRRLMDLESRLSRINVQADMASSNASRAEGLLIAFAVRRALDKGRSLGYLDGQLQVRFGAQHPQEVKLLREFAGKPVTLESLQSGLDNLGEKLFAGGEGSFLDQIGREFSELFTIRRNGSPPTDSEARLNRAKRYAAAGNIPAAVAEVEKLPGADKAEKWLADARAYAAAQEALDLLEMAAIFETNRAQPAAQNLPDAEGAAQMPVSGGLVPNADANLQAPAAKLPIENKPDNSSDDGSFFGF